MRWSGNTKKTLIVTILVLFIVSFFISMPIIKCDQNSEVTTVTALTNTNTNIGTVLNQNGYDIFCTDLNVLLYDGNGSNLRYKFVINLLPTGSTEYGLNQKPITRIINFNETHILIVNACMDDASNNYVSRWNVRAWLLNTNNFSNTTIEAGEILDSQSQSYSNIGARFNSMLLFKSNNIFYIYLSGIWTGNVGGYSAQYDVILASVSLSGVTYITGNENAPASSVAEPLTINSTLLSIGASYWIASQTELNTVYIIGTASGNEQCFRILKINCVTPSITFIGDYDYNYVKEWVYYVDYAYQTITGSNYYDIMFLHPVYGTINSFAVELLRFNDTGLYNCWQTTYTDTNAFGNLMRNFGCLTPTGMWGNSQYDTLYDSISGYNFNIAPLYAGALTIIYAHNFYTHDLNTNSPTFEFAVTGAYQFNNGGNSISIFSDSNNVGGILSPYGYGNEFQIDFQHLEVCTSYQISTNPSTGLSLHWDIEPINSQKTVILPQTYGSYSLSQNHTYIQNAHFLIGGVQQTTDCIINVWSNGEGSTVFDRQFNIPIVINAEISDGDVIFTLKYDSTMQKQPKYEAYQINITKTGFTYTFIMAITWRFQDINGNTLPDSLEGYTTGYGGQSGQGDTSGTGESAFTYYWAVIIIYVIITLLFSLIAGKSGLMAGLILATVFCMIAGLIPIWVIIPIILVCIVLLFYSRETGGV